MQLFDILRSILYTKQHITLNCDDESQFSVFMLNRWSSFYSPEVANIINETTNKNWMIFTSKQDTFDYLFNVMPKLKFKKLEYIKKTKKEKTKEEVIHVPEFYSEREYKACMDLVETLSK